MVARDTGLPKGQKNWDVPQGLLGGRGQKNIIFGEGGGECIPIENPNTETI